MSGIVKAKKITNAEVLRNMIELDRVWSEEHDGEEILNENTRNAIQDILNTSTDDEEINRKFNKILRPVVLK